MAVGKKKIFTDRAHHNSSTDPFRHITRKYWDKQNSFNISKQDNDSEYGESFSSAGVPFEIIFAGDTNRIEHEKFYEFEQKIIFKANQARSDNESQPATAWSNLINELYEKAQDQKYYDHSFAMELPYSEKELKILNLSQKVNTANIIPNYNFYIEGYEEQVQKQAISENLLPNLYVFALAELEGEEGYNIRDDDLDGLISLGGRTDKNILKSRNRPLKEKTRVEDSDKKYFSNFGKHYKAYSKNRKRKLKRMANRFSEMSIDNSVIDNIGSYNEKAYIFPMYTDIEFVTDRSTYVAEILKTANLSNKLMSYVIDNKGSLNKMPLAEAHNKIIQPPSKELEKVAKFESKIRVKEYQTFDLLQWWEENSDNMYSDNPLNALNRIMISQSVEPEDEHSKIRQGYLQHINKTIFVSKFRKFIKNYTRSYKSIINGDHSYSETLMYRVDKYLGPPTGRPIQSFYLCNSNEVETLNILDTQVKYDTEYTYVIVAYELVLGTEYHYKDLSTNTRETAEGKVECLAEVIVVSRPSLKVVQVPIFAEKERIIDDPPVSPDIDIIPYRGVNNRLLFNFMGNVGEYYLDPIFFNKEEERNYEEIRKAQKLFPNEPIRFSSDDPAAVFEVFRTVVKPKSYQDFKNAKRVTVKTDVSEETIQKAATASYVEFLSPNTKYYYIFRSIDIHGHISYPSHVYEVELVDDAGATYLLIKTVDFEPETKKRPSRNMKKYLHIIPSLAQALVNPEKSGLVNEDGMPIDSAKLSDGNIQLGFQESPIWGKRFKVRLTSKQTGRKLDLNIKFDQKHITTENDYATGEIIERTQSTTRKIRARSYYKRKDKNLIEEEDLQDLLS